jgi:LAO/AO transport system kinase
MATHGARLSASVLLNGVLKGDRASLARAITLVESSHPERQKEATWMLDEVARHNIRRQQLGKQATFRVGLSGAPGTGKSTFIEHFGTMLTGRGHKVAVLAVDPTSTRTGGAILGDKTRMQKLAQDPNAYIRPSPTSGTLGGVTRSTNEAILLCEAAGYDVVLVETVGVGQSEVAVDNMVDTFVLLVQPAAGDELQGLKKGIMELADLVVITKADGELVSLARQIKAEYISALKLMSRKHVEWVPKVMSVSALKKEGLEELWDVLGEFRHKMEETGYLQHNRQQQRLSWMWSHVEHEVMRRLRRQPLLLKTLEDKVVNGTLSPRTAAETCIDNILL